MTITKLKNPKTKTYREFKKLINSTTFPWQWHSVSTRLDPKIIEDNGKIYHNISFYTHPFLTRPEGNPKKFPIISSPYVDGAVEVFSEILEYNNVEMYSFLRMGVNCVHPFEEIKNSIPHIDHPFEHNNILIYLTNAGGRIFVEDSFHDPEEDDVIIFEGKTHFHQTPASERRLALVATYI